MNAARLLLLLLSAQAWAGQVTLSRPETDLALVPLAQVPRIALHIHREYVDPMPFEAALARGLDGALAELGPRALLKKEEALPRLLQALTPASGEALTSSEAILRGASFYRSLWDSSAGPVDVGRVAQGSLRTMVGSLDAHSEFYDPAQYAKVLHLFRGTQGKLGVTFEDKAFGPRLVTAVARGSAAEAAGLEPGDEVLAVDGRPVADLDLDSFRALLRKDEVGLTVRRPGAPDRETRLKRGTVKPPEVLAAALLRGRAGYLRIGMFQTDAGEPIQARLLKLLAAGAKSIILDLRGNPGGEEQTGLQAASLFLPKDKVIARFAGRAGTDEARTAEDGELAATPVQVLVDGDTASAAELVAAALQDHARGPLIGARTYGKGTKQQFFGLEDGSGFKMTIGRWLTPGGRRLDREKDGGGLEPDVAVAPEMGPDAVVSRALDLVR